MTKNLNMAYLVRMHVFLDAINRRETSKHNAHLLVCLCKCNLGILKLKQLFILPSSCSLDIWIFVALFSQN